MSFVLGNQVVTDELQERFRSLAPRQRRGIESLLLGAATVEAALFTSEGDKVSMPQGYITLLANSGVIGDTHNCPTARVDSREDVLHRILGFPKGMAMANLRQVTLTCREDGQIVAVRMGLGVDAVGEGLQMENLSLSGFASLSGLAPRTLVTFFSPDGRPRSVTLHVIAPNAPCGHPDRAIREHYGISKPAQPYTTAAEDHRGLVAVVKTSGINPGDTGRLYVGDIAVFWKHN